MNSFRCSRRAVGDCARVSRGRRRGISLWLFVATLPIICGTCGLVIDVGQLQARRAQAQRAVDAAALAGAYTSGTDNSNVEPKADYYADCNGFSSARGDTVSVVTNYETGSLQNANALNTVKVSIAHQEPVYFAPICEALLSFMGWSSGAATFSRQVTARAVARKFVRLPMSTGGNYGIGTGSESVVNNIISGPFGYYSNADPWSTRFLDDGTKNPRYAETGGYSNFTFHVSDDFIKNASVKKVYLQVFDPGSSNPASGPTYDLYTGANRKITDWTGYTAPLVKTKYEIFKQNADGTLEYPVVASAVYGADDATTDGQWVTPDGFAVDLNVYGAGDYKVRISSLDGFTTNDYALRAGPVEGLTMNDHNWNQAYGDKLGTAPDNVAVPMNADGRLMIGFRSNGTAQLKLGHLGPEYAGKTVTVSHFDLDIAAQSLNYTIDSLPDFSSPGKILSPSEENGHWGYDSITLPPDFKGGNLSAMYAAGVNSTGYDGSSWELFGAGDGDGVVRLIE